MNSQRDCSDVKIGIILHCYEIKGTRIINISANNIHTVDKTLKNTVRFGNKRVYGFQTITLHFNTRAFGK